MAIMIYYDNDIGKSNGNGNSNNTTNNSDNDINDDDGNDENNKTRITIIMIIKTSLTTTIITTLMMTTLMIAKMIMIVNTNIIAILLFYLYHAYNFHRHFCVRFSSKIITADFFFSRFTNVISYSC